MGWDWVHLVRRPLIGLLYQPGMMDKYGAVQDGHREDMEQSLEWELAGVTEVLGENLPPHNLT
jgi:hypothetical protein